MSLPPKLTRRDRDLLPHLNRDIASRLAVRAFMNAAALLDAARATFNRGHFGTARSLAISAREECGKGFTAGSYLAGVISPDEFAAGLRNHHFKQTEGLIGPMLAEGLLGNPDLIETLMIGASGPPEEAVRVIAMRMNERQDELRHALGGTLDRLRESLELASSGADERERQAGIYVSLEITSAGVELQYPQQITADQAQREMDRLDVLLRAFLGESANDLSSEYWMDDHAVEQFADRMNRMFPHGIVATPDQAK